MPKLAEESVTHLRAATFLALLGLISVGVAEAQPISRYAAIGACMEKAAASLGYSGTVYARYGNLATERSFGTSDADGKVPNGFHTRFNIGSVNEMFIAVAIGKLVDSGAVQFDAPISRYLGGLKPEISSLTLGELLDNTSGLGDYVQPENRTIIDAARTAADLLPLALASPPAFRPGSKRLYSSSGFVVLGAIIEKVSGLTWAQFIQKEVLEPLRMTDTRFDSIGGATPMSRISPSGLLAKPRPVVSPLLASPASGIFSTPSDLSAFLTALFNGRIVSKATLDVLLTPRPDPGGGPGTSGYGFVIREQPTRLIDVSGGAPGVNADVAYLPDSGWQLITLSNTDPPAAIDMDRVLERVVQAQDTGPACATALADPKLRSMPMIPLATSIKTKM